MLNKPSVDESADGGLGPLASRIARRQKTSRFTKALGVLFGQEAEAPDSPEEADESGEPAREPATQPAGLNRGALLSRLQGTHRAHLNRGFYALLDAGQPAPAREEGAAYRAIPASDFTVVMVDTACVHANPFLPPFVIDDDVLDLLAQGIREQGILEPVHVLPAPQLAPDGSQHYWVVLGERHRQAAVRAGAERLPVVVREVSPRAGLQMFLAQYVHTRAVTMLVRAQVYQTLTTKMGMTVPEVAERVGVPAAQIDDDLALLQLDEPIQDSLRHEQLSYGQAKVLLKVQDPDIRMALWHYAVRYRPAPARMEQRLARLEAVLSKDQG